MADQWFEGKVPKHKSSLVGKMVANLREMGATPAELKVRIGRYRKTFPNAACTLTAIVNQWHTVSKPAEPVEEDVFAGLVRRVPTSADFDDLRAADPLMKNRGGAA